MALTKSGTLWPWLCIQTAYIRCHLKVNVFVLAVFVIHVECYAAVLGMVVRVDASPDVMSRLPETGWLYKQSRQMIQFWGWMKHFGYKDSKAYISSITGDTTGMILEISNMNYFIDRVCPSTNEFLLRWCMFVKARWY